MRVAFFSLVLTALAATAVQAGPREDVMAGAVRCAGIEDNRAWLDCYYGAAQPMRAELGLPPAPATQVNRVPPPLGAAASAAPPPRGKDFLDRFFSGASAKTRLTAYSFDRKGIFTVTLANGQVWAQLPSDVNYAHWKGPAGNYNVSVAEGGFGRGDLTVENDGATYQVRRMN